MIGVMGFYEVVYETSNWSRENVSTSAVVCLVMVLRSLGDFVEQSDLLIGVLWGLWVSPGAFWVPPGSLLVPSGCLLGRLLGVSWLFLGILRSDCHSG